MGHRLPIAKSIIDHTNHQVGIMMVSYRGYVLSTGSPSESGFRVDAQTALEHVLKRQGDSRIDTSKIVIYGQSIGGAVAIDLASRNASRVAGLIVENTFISLSVLVKHVLPALSWASALLLHQRWDSDRRLQDLADKLSAEAVATSTEDKPVSKCNFRMLFLSGARDELIPVYHMQRLYSIIRTALPGTKFQSFPDGTHNDTFLKKGYFEAISKFLSDI